MTTWLLAGLQACAIREISTTTAAMPLLISNLKSRGYRFVTLTEYMKTVAPTADRNAMRAAVQGRIPGN